MLSFITVVVLNSSHGTASETMIKPAHIMALRTPQSGIGCALSYKGLETEVLTKETCAVINERANFKAPKASKEKAKAVSPWLK